MGGARREGTRPSSLQDEELYSGFLSPAIGAVQWTMQVSQRRCLEARMEIGASGQVCGGHSSVGGKAKMLHGSDSPTTNQLRLCHQPAALRAAADRPCSVRC